MEAQQLEKKVGWLDEQRRKDLEAVHKLSDRIKTFEESLDQQARQIKDASGEVARLAALAARIHQFDDALHKHRQQVSRQLEELEDLRLHREGQLEEIRRSELESLAKDLAELRTQSGLVDGLKEAIETSKQEQLRLSRSVDTADKRLDTLEQKIEDSQRLVGSLEESRKGDFRRVTDLQTETSELRGRLDGLQGNLDVADDRFRRLETKLAELTTSESERREDMRAWTENQTRRLLEFERAWGDWEKRFEAFEQQAADLDDRMLRYEETYRHIKQLQGDMEEVIERLERRISEVTEMQRLSEDRTKREWAAFQADDQNRWNTFKLTNEEKWREHIRQHEKMDVELGKLNERLTRAAEQASTLSDIGDARVRDLLAMVMEWAEQVESKGGSEG